MKKNLKAWMMACVAVMAGAWGAPGAEVSLEEAETAVGNWMARGGAYGQLVAVGGTAGETWEDAGTGAKFHVVRTEGGYAVTTADDTLEPVVAWGDGEPEWLVDEGHPFRALLLADWAARAADAASADLPAARRGASGDAKAKWAGLLGRPGAKAAANGLASIAEVRHGAMLGIKWHQQKNTFGNYMYNLYLPYKTKIVRGMTPKAVRPAPRDQGGDGEGDDDGIVIDDRDPGDDGGGGGIHDSYTVKKLRTPAGCVATAGGQLMHWWRWPTGAVARTTRTCTAFGKMKSMTTKGGTYNWGGMGGAEPRTEAQGRAVSKLLHDIAVLCKADFEMDGTSMSDHDFASSLTGKFGYAGARWTGMGTYDGTALERAVVPNLDAGAPVLLGIRNPKTGTGHEVVADGCGTDSGEFAVHLNLGWGGSGTMWYKPPKIFPNSSQNYTVVEDVVCNVSPTNRGEIVSGRVLGPNGRPVSRAAVTVKNASGTVVWRGTAGMDGIYAWWGASAGAYTVSAAVGNATGSATAVVAAGSSSAVGNAICDVTVSGAPSAGTVALSSAQAKGRTRGTAISGPTAVTLSCAVSGAEIRYTLDGGEPTAESARYEGPIVVQQTLTLKAAAFADGRERGTTSMSEWTFSDTASRDAFVSARTLAGAEGRSEFTNAGYTLESGEPVHSPDGYEGGASAWAKWTAPRSGRWWFSLDGTSDGGGSLDTQLAVYKGSAVESLSRVAANDDSGGTYASRLAFTAVSGTTYRIAMDTYNGKSGTMTLEWGTNGVETAGFSQYGQYVPASGATFSVTVDSTAPWTLPGVCDWATANPESGVSGKAVTVTVEANDDDEYRIGSVWVQAGNDETAELGELQLIQATVDFCTNRASAVARATAEGKRILLLSGRETCGNTRWTLLDSIPGEGARARLEAGYVLWYCNCDRQGDEVWPYSDGLGGYTLPLVCTLDPADMGSYLVRTTAYQSAEQLAETMGNVVVFRSEEEDRDVAIRYPASGAALGTLPSATLRGYRLDGWFTAPSGGSRATAATVPGTGVTRYYAHWIPTNQVVTFDPNGGTCATEAKTYAVGAPYGTLPTPKRSGHVFLGWFTAAEGGTKVEGTDKATAETARTLWAHWTDQQVTIFKGNGGTPSTQRTTNTIYAAYGELPTATRSGHVLVGWYTAAEGGKRVYTNSTVTLAAERTLYAQWTDQQVVTFKGNGGTPATQKTTNTIYAKYGTFPAVAWTNHVFLGWYTKANAGDGKRIYTNSTVTLAAARTLYAQWTDQQVVTFKGNGGTPETKKTTNTMGKAYGTLPTPKWSGHVFLGWFTEAEGGTEVKGTDKVTAATARTLYAHWTDRQVTVFKGNGGTPATQATTNTIYADYGVLPTAKRSEQALVGWFTAPEGGKRVYTNSTVTLAATRTLYAQWTDRQVVTFKGNGGTPATQKTTNTIYAKYGDFPTVTWTNHVFLGWYTTANAADGKRIYTNSTVTLSAARTLYAQWTDEQVVTFKGNGGSPTTVKTTNTMGMAYGPLPTPNKSGHAFLGWFTAAEGGDEVTEQDLVTATTTLTLYAHWTDQQVTVFKGNGGTPETQATTNTIYAAYGELPTAKRTGQILVGWFTVPEGGKRIYTNSIVTLAATRTLYAHWTDQQVTTFKGNGGTPATQKTTNTIYGAYGELPTATWSGHVFQGWFNAKEGGKRVYTNSTVTLAATRTLYAHWTTARGFAITAIAVGADGGDEGTSSRAVRGEDKAENICRLRFELTEGTEYEIQWTASMDGEWETVEHLTAETDGEVEVEIEVPGGEKGFFRLMVFGDSGVAD